MELREEQELAIRRIADAFNEEGPEAFASLGPEVVIATAPEWPDGGEFRGSEEIVAFLHRFTEAWEEIRLEHGEPEHFGDRIVFAARWVATGRTSRIPTTISFHMVATYREAEVSRIDFFFRERDARAFAQAGPAGT